MYLKRVTRSVNLKKKNLTLDSSSCNDLRGDILFLVIDILKFDEEIDRKGKMGKSRKRTKEKTKIGIHRIPYSHVYTHTLHARLLS